MAFCCVTSAVSRCAVGGRSVPFSQGKRDTYWLCRTRTAFQRYAFSENTRRGVRFFCVEMMIALCFVKRRWRFSMIFVQIVLPVAFPVLHVPRFSMPPPHVGARSRRLGNRSFSQKRGTLSRNTRSFRVFVAGSRARTYAHSAGFRFLPSPFVCYRLIFSALWVKMVFFRRFTPSRPKGDTAPGSEVVGRCLFIPIALSCEGLSHTVKEKVKENFKSLHP